MSPLFHTKIFLYKSNSNRCFPGVSSIIRKIRGQELNLGAYQQLMVEETEENRKGHRKHKMRELHVEMRERVTKEEVAGFISYNPEIKRAKGKRVIQLGQKEVLDIFVRWCLLQANTHLIF